MRIKKLAKNLKCFIAKYKLWFVGVIIFLLASYPFIFPFINKIFKLNCGELYTFGLPLEDFLTPWIALWGITCTIFTIIQLDRRISKSDKQFCDSRFSTSVSLLGNENESVRIGGIYNLHFLASEYPDEYLNIVCEIFCAYIRNTTREIKCEKRTSDEIQIIIDLLFKRDCNGKLIFESCKKDLSGSCLHKINANNEADCRNQYILTNVDFSEAVLNEVFFDKAIFTNVCFINAKLNSVNFCEAKLNNVNFEKATLDETCFLSTISNDIKFYYAKLRDCTFREISTKSILSYINFDGATLDKVIFNKAKLSHVAYNGAILNDVDFTSTNLDDIEFYEIKFSDGYFGGAILNNVDFSKSKLHRISFPSAKLNEVKFLKTVLENYSNEEIIKRSLELTSEE